MNRIKSIFMAGFLVFFSVSSVAKQESIEECTRFLPKDKQYEITIQALSDKTKEKPSFDGNFNIDWSEEDSNALTIDITDFVKCVAPLITSEPNL